MSRTTSSSASEAVTGSAGTLIICHDYDSGTTVAGTTRNSPAHHAIKANRSWTWSRHAGAWLLRSSRHRRPKFHEIDAMERTLTALGYQVTREIDEAMPTVEQQEADLADRLDQRADRLGERAEKWSGKSAASRAAADAVYDLIPLGQPMMPGHYSYPADRNRRERADNNMRSSFEQADYGAELSRRSDAAAAHMGARHNPVTVGNRIAKLEADRRAVQRQLTGDRGLETDADEGGNTGDQPVVHTPDSERVERLAAEAADLDEQITYWKDVYAALQAGGQASTAGPATVARGDWVLVRGHWYRVRRVNKKTVSVPSHLVKTPEPGRREWTDTTPWHEVRAHRTTEQMPPAFVDAYEQPGRDRFRLNPTDFADGTP